MVHQKQLQNVEYFNCVGSKINDARCTREIKYSIDMAKAAFNRKKTLSNCKLDLNLRKYLERGLAWCCNWDTSESR
jgi:hypothetical protein